MAASSIVGLLVLATWSVHASHHLVEEMKAPQAGASSVTEESAADSNWKQTLADLEKRVDLLERAQKMPELIAREGASSVALVIGEYIWTDRSGRRPLRYQGLDESGAPLRDPRGAEIVAFEGSGPVVVRDFGGTGFLLNSGQMLTSGFILAPWAEDPLLDESEEPEVVPSIRLLHAYLPGHAQPFDVKIEHAAEDAGKILCSLHGSDVPKQGLHLDFEAPVETGEALIAIGYPGGVSLLVSRAPDDVKRDLFKFGPNNTDEVASMLAQRGLIQPVVMQGRVSGKQDGKIFYDMLSALGTTGGPLLNAHGKVVAMSQAVLPAYPSFNFAVPVKNFQSWLREIGLEPGRDALTADSFRPDAKSIHR